MLKEPPLKWPFKRVPLQKLIEKAPLHLTHIKQVCASLAVPLFKQPVMPTNGPRCGGDGGTT